MERRDAGLDRLGAGWTRHRIPGGHSVTTNYHIHHGGTETTEKDEANGTTQATLTFSVRSC